MTAGSLGGPQLQFDLRSPLHPHRAQAPRTGIKVTLSSGTATEGGFDRPLWSKLLDKTA
jgi:hypothetical protein